jgi:hypothetical protein
MEVAKTAYAAFNAGDIGAILPLMSPTIEWIETAGYRYGGRFHSPQEILRSVFAKVPEAYESFSVEIDRLIDAGDVIVMQGRYVAAGKATGKSTRAAVAHVIQVADGKIVRFDQYVDSATLNAIIGA